MANTYRATAIVDSNVFDAEVMPTDIYFISEGGEGTTDYEELGNKPRINGVEVVGDKTSADLGITATGAYSALTGKPTINGVEVDGDLSLADLGITPSGGTADYEDLANKPQINEVTLVGNLTTNDLAIDPSDIGIGMATNMDINALDRKSVV